ncbi:MAG: hypothetical protein AB1411_00615 [Nitrospirota bacterium]
MPSRPHRSFRQLVSRILAKTRQGRHEALAQALAQCVLHASGDGPHCPLGQWPAVPMPSHDTCASAEQGAPGDPAFVRRAIGHSLLMGEAMWMKDTRYLDALHSCERFTKKCETCALHRVLNAKAPFFPPAS